MLTLIQAGDFTSDGNAKDINLPANADFIEVINYTQSATTQTPGRGVRFEWQKGMDDDKGLEWKKEDGADTLELVEMSSGGFTLYESVPAPGPELTGTAVTAANPAEVTINGHGLSDGDRFRLYSTTGMLQIAGMDFTIDNVAANTFELAYLDGSGFAAAATAVKGRLLPKADIVDPAVRYITSVSQASQGVIVFSVDHNYKVDQLIEFVVPSDFGMVELDGLTGKVLEVNATNNSITVDIDTSAFTAFAFPASGSDPFRFAQAAPDGHQKNYEGELAYKSGSFVPFVHLASGAQSPAGSDNDVIYYRAYRSE